MLLVTLFSGAVTSAAVWSTIISVLFVVYFFLWKQKRDKFVQAIDKLPGPQYDSFFGHALMFNVKRAEKFKKFLEVFKTYVGTPVARIWLLGSPKIFLLNADAARALLSSNTEIYKGNQYRFLEGWLGCGLVMNSTSSWHGKRKLITPTFHFKNLEGFVDIFNEQAIILTEKTGKSEGKMIDYSNYFTHCTMDIICDAAMGTQINAQQNGDTAYLKAATGVQDIFSQRSFKPWLRNDFLFKFTSKYRQNAEHLKVLHGFTDNVINQRRIEYKKLKAARDADPNHKQQDEEDIYRRKRRLNFLDMLLENSENGPGLTHEEIRDEVSTFMFAGHDTTATAMLWSTFSIGHHPEVQAKVHEELDSIFGDSDRHVTLDDIRDLVYLEMVIKESLRKYPPGPFFSRTLREDFTIDGHTILAGETATLSSFMVHRDPTYFPDPEKFDPERFSPENAAGRHPYAFIPFSAGPRNCLGQKFGMFELKVVLSHLLRKFTVKSFQTFEELDPIGELVLRPMKELYLQFNKRK